MIIQKNVLYWGKNKKTYLEVINIGIYFFFESPREIDIIGNILVGI